MAKRAAPTSRKGGRRKAEPRKKKAAPKRLTKAQREKSAAEAKARRAADLSLEELVLILPGYDPRDHIESGMYFDEEAAEHALGFFPAELVHVKGASAGEPFHLELWQQAIVANLFGWKREDGSRRFRHAWLYVAKKNGKSAFAAGIILYVMTQDGERGAEIYSVAGARKQAFLVFEHAAGMVKASPGLGRCLKVFGFSKGAQSKSIQHRKDMLTSYQCLAADADTADGVSPHLNVIDEVHRHKKPDVAQVLVKSTAARWQPINLWLTTADYNRESLCNDMLRRAKEVLDNGGDRSKPGFDSTFLPVIYEAHKDDPIDCPKTWAKANPNLGVTVSEEFMAAEAQVALENPSEYNNFVRLNLNIVTDSDEAWLPMEKWDHCKGKHDFHALAKKMRGKRAFAGLDLSKRVDLTSFVVCIPEKRVLLSWFWIPKDTAVRQEKDQPKRLLYSTWARSGHLTLVPGSEIDYRMVLAHVLKCCKRYDIQMIGVDPWESSHISRELREDHGLDVIEMIQGHKTLGPATKELETWVVTETLRHGGHPVLRWNAANAVVRYDENLNIVPGKKRSSGQIDGIMASVMSIALGILDDEGAEDLDELYSSEDEWLEA